MKYLPTITLILGIAGVAFSPLCCRWVRVEVFPSATISQTLPTTAYEGESKMIAETKRFFGTLGLGMFLLCFSSYLRERSKGGNLVDRVMMHARFCSKCGRPLRRRDCRRKKQFGFVPRLVCSACDGYARWSSGLLMAVGLVLTGGPFLVAYKLNSVSDRFLEIGFYSFITGFIIFMLGLLRHDHQLKRAQCYVSSQKQSL